MLISHPEFSAEDFPTRKKMNTFALIGSGIVAAIAAWED